LFRIKVFSCHLGCEKAYTEHNFGAATCPRFGELVLFNWSGIILLPIPAWPNRNAMLVKSMLKRLQALLTWSED